jgi:hypothetical protein
MSAETKFETWALVELFGHARIVGLVTEQAIGGASFIRVDVPKPDGSVNFTRFFGPSAIYAISPIAKDMAVRMAQLTSARPVEAYEIPKLAESTQTVNVIEDPDEEAEEP